MALSGAVFVPSAVGQPAGADTAISERAAQARATSAALSPQARDSARQLFSSAFQLFQSGDFAAAKLGFERGLAIDPANAVARYYLAETLSRTNDRTRAREHYEMAAALAPNTPEGLKAEAALAALVVRPWAFRLKNTLPDADPRTAAAKKFADDLHAASEQRIKVDIVPNTLPPFAFQVPDAIVRGEFDAAWISPAALWQKDKAFGVLAGPPFGPPSRAYVAWRARPGVAAMVDELYQRHGLKGVLCAIQGPRGGLWSKRQISAPSDVAGLRVRVVGIMIDLCASLGCVVNALPAGEVFPALERNLLDAAMQIDPYMDYRLGMERAARIYYFPWVVETDGLDFVVKRSVWDELPAATRTHVETVCAANVERMLVENEARTRDALAAFRSRGVQIQELPPAVMAETRRAWGRVSQTMAAQSPMFQRLLDSMTR